MVARHPAVAWLGFTVHGGEASGTEAAIALLYQLAAGQDAGTRLVLDSVVVLIDPVQNPDGHERHVQDVLRARGALGVPPSPAAAIHQGSWPGPRTSHYYFDLNRDWFVLSHPESRARIAAFLAWWPMVAVDLHEMGGNSTYYFAPPAEPVNPHITRTQVGWFERFGEANARLVAQSKRDAINRIELFVHESKAACGFSRVPGFLYAERDGDIECGPYCVIPEQGSLNWFAA